MTGTDRGDKVAQAYRALGAEEPSHVLDEAILAAARRRPAGWRVPLSVAAVLVLAVGVTMRMLPHGLDAESVALAPQVIETPRPAVPPADQAGAPERRALRSPAPRRVEPTAERLQVLTPASADASGEPHEESALSNEARQRADAEAATQIAAAAPRALAAAKSAEPATPEAWLERIAELKKQGREREAKASLAEFRKRYPDFRIPAALRQ